MAGKDVFSFDGVERDLAFRAVDPAAATTRSADQIDRFNHRGFIAPLSHNGLIRDAGRSDNDLYTDDCVSDATWAEVTQHFGEPDVIHLIATAGTYRLVSGCFNGAGIQLDDGVPGWPTPSGGQGQPDGSVTA